MSIEVLEELALKSRVLRNQLNLRVEDMELVKKSYFIKRGEVRQLLVELRAQEDEIRKVAHELRS